MKKNIKTKNDYLQLWLALALMIICIPLFSIEVFADTEPGDTPKTRSVQYYDPIVNEMRTQDCMEVEQNMGATYPAWYVVSKNTIFEEPVKIVGNVNLILCNGATLTAKKGIRVERQCDITIWAQARAGNDRGAIVATGADGAAGIGAAANGNVHDIIINGGYIVATGDNGAAGIGGGSGRDSGFHVIEIRTSTVYANGAAGGAGIGAGYGNDQYIKGNWGTVLIRKAMVFAKGGESSEGGGDTGSGIRCRALTINSAKDDRTEFTGMGKGSGIDAQEVTIQEGVVNATGGNGGGAGIGSGNEAEMTGTVNILGGNVTATGGECGAGIGSGNEADMNGTVSIRGGNVTATGGNGAAGIGSGGKGDFIGTVNISGGTTKAVGNTQIVYDVIDHHKKDSGGAGIGSGYEGNARAGHIHITGGMVNASGGKYGAGIGGGRESLLLFIGGEGCDDVQISGEAHIYAQGGLSTLNSSWYGSAIGSGYHDAHDGTIRFGEGLNVRVIGGSAVSAGKRQDTCNDNRCVEIKPCDHPDPAYKDEGDEGHRQYCDYCLYSGFHIEKHVYPDAQAPVCSVCGHGLESVPVTFKQNNGNEDIIQTLQPGRDDYPLPYSTGITPPEGKIFAGWKMENGEIRQPEDPFYVGTAPITINAVWTDKVDITYSGNKYDETHFGGIIPEGSNMGLETYVEYSAKGSVYTIPKLDVRFFSDDGTSKTFKGWQMDGNSDLLQPGDRFTADKDVNLTAIWDTWTVTYDFNDGTDKKRELKVIPGEKAPQPEDPTSKEMIFLEWTLDGEPYNFETPVTRDITLTVKWKGIPDPITDQGQPADKEWELFETDDSKRTLSVEVTEGSDVTFQWYLIKEKGADGVAIQGASGNSYTVPEFTSAGVRYYYCIVTNHVGSVSKSFPTREAKVTIRKTQAEITSAPEPSADLIYNGQDQILASPGTVAGGKMKYSLDGSTFSDDVPAAKNAGSYTVYYKAEGDENHAGEEVSSISVTIQKAQVTITAEDQIGPDPAGQTMSFPYRIKGDLAAEDEDGLGIAVNLGEKQDTTPATYLIEVSCNPDDSCRNNYQIITKTGTYTVEEALTFNMTGYFGEYDGEEHSIVMDSNGMYRGLIYSRNELIIPRNLVTLDEKTEYFARAGEPSVAFADVGEHPVYYCILANDGTILSGKTEITILPKNVTIKADDKTKFYGEEDPVLTYKAEGLLEGDEIRVSLKRAAGEDLGTYDILLDSIGLVNQNYRPVYVPATLTIKKPAPKFTPPAARNLTYNGEAQALVTAGSIDSGEILYSVDGINWDVSIPTGVDAGTYQVWYKAAADKTHTETEAQRLTTVIGKGSVLISADDKVGLYPKPDDFELTYHIFGSIPAADREKLHISLALNADAQTTENGLRIIPIEVKCLTSNENYEIRTENGRYTVSDDEEFQFTVNGYLGEYDGSPYGIDINHNDKCKCISFTKEKLEIPQDLSTKQLENYLDEKRENDVSFTNVGTHTAYYYILTNKDELISGSKDVVITPKPATVIADAKTKAYGENDPELTFTAEGLVMITDDEGIEKAEPLKGELTREKGEHVGTYAILEGNLKESNPNYDLTFTGANLTIIRAASKVVDAPRGNTLTWTGAAKALVTEGRAEGGTMLYAAGKDADTIPTEGWGAEIPTAADVGTYYIWYKVEGDGEHKDSDAACVTAKIEAGSKTTDQKAAEEKTTKESKKVPAVKIKTTRKTFKAAALQKKARVFKIKYSKTKGSGKASFKKVKGSRKIKVGKTGKVRILKGTKKGIYRIRVKVSVAANTKFKAKSITRTIKITIKK